MKIIVRDSYLDKMKHVMNTPDIKVITGIRRSGKSKLLEAFITYLKNNNPDANIIHINYNDMDFEDLKEYHALYKFVKDQYQDGKENFLLIDEIQLCKGFELAINSFHASEKYHIYITGSNAFLLANDLATLFTGRAFNIKVFPFSFFEYQKYFQITDIDAAFDSYTHDGEMAGSYIYDEESEKSAYIRDVFDTLVTRDIVQKYKIRNPALLERLNDFLLDNISSEVSLRKISDILTNHKEPINHKTVSSYVTYLCNAFSFYKVRRYDIRGKKYLTSQDKYYLADHSFRYAKLGTRNMDYGRIFENMVAIELLRRGYEVYTGVLYKKEIDFVAMKQSEKIYIQVSDNIQNQATFEREITPLLCIKDAYPKILIARTKHDEYSEEGIKIVDIARWLINAE